MKPKQPARPSGALRKVIQPDGNRLEQKLTSSSEKEQKSESDLQRMVHKLQVQLVELEMQNEELSRLNQANAGRKKADRRAGRKASDEALRQTEEMHRAFFEQGAVGMAHVSPDGRPLMVNDKFCEITGYSREELLKMSGSDLLPNEERHPISKVSNPFFDGELPVYTAKKRYLRKDGSVRWVSVTARLLRDEGGRPLHSLAVVEDITDREKAAEALRASEERLRLALVGANDGIWDVQLSTGLVYLSPRGCEILGYAPEDLADLNQVWKALVHPDDLALTNERLENYLQGRTPFFEVEQRLRTKQGGWKWVLTRGKLLDSSVGEQARRMTGTHTDISERKRTEEELRLSNRELRTISGCSQVLVRAPDEQTLLNEICRIICEVAGYRMAWVGYSECDDAKTVRPVAWAGFEDGYLKSANISWLNNEVGQGPVGNCIRTGKSCYAQYFQTNSQTAYWRESAQQRGYQACIGLPLLGESGVAFGALAIYSTEAEAFAPEEIRLLEELAGDLAFGLLGLRSHAERKRGEIQLLKLSQAVSESPVSIVITNRQGTIEYVNPKFTQLTGYTAEEAIGQNPRILKSGLTPAKTYKELWNCLSAGVEWRGEFKNRKKNGDLFLEDAHIAAIRDKTGAITHFLAIKEDITQRKENETQLLRSQRIDTIGTLANGIAHDLNNILAPILMAVGALQYEELSTESSEMLNIIEGNTKRGADVVRQLLSFSRGTEDKTVLQPKHLVREMVKIASETFPKSVTIESSVDPDCWQISANATQVHQVLLNLCVNARDAMPHGGQLALAIKNVVLDDNNSQVPPDAKRGPYILLTVSDTGTGIPVAIRERIFDPFFTTKASGLGTGLGLASVLVIVKGHSGFLQFDSEVGKGTRFRVYLPAVSEPLAAENPLVNSRPPQGRGQWILVVDDEAPIRAVIQKTLQACNYQVLTAKNGADALVVYNQNHNQVDLVILDVMMPVMEGPEALVALRALNPSLKVIISSGMITREQDEKISNITTQGRLSKPFTAQGLLSMVGTVLDCS